MSALDLSLSFPSRGVIRLKSRDLFGDADHPTCRRFLHRVFQADEITGVTIRPGRDPHADLAYCPRSHRPEGIVDRVIAMLRHGEDGTSPPPARRDGAEIRYARPAAAATTGWTIQDDEPGRLVARNRQLRRRSESCRAVERALRSVLGVECSRTSPRTGTVRVDYDPTQLDASDVLAILDDALAAAGPPGPTDPIDLHLPLCTASMPIAAAAQFAVPALLPAAAALLLVTAIPTLRQAGRTLARERRLGAEAIDSAVVLGCLGTMAIFPGAVLCWSLGLGRTLVDRTSDNARRMLLDGFARRPHRARLLVDDDDDAERLVPAARLRAGDRVVVDAGEVVPVDGRITAGRALIDPHALPGDSGPAEVAVGGRVLAATLVLGGRITVVVEAVAEETAAAHIVRSLDAAAAFRHPVHERGERLAGRLALPTLAIGGVGIAAMGAGVGIAALNRDFASGLRLSAPLAVHGALATCAHRGIFLNDAGALDRAARVDAILIDRTALVPDLPEVLRALRDRGIRHVALVADDPEAIADRSEVDALIAPADKRDHLEKLRSDGRIVCIVGDGVGDPTAMARAELSVSTRGVASIASDVADIVLPPDGLSRLVELREIARDLDRTLGRSWSTALLPNLAGLAGVFAMGLGLLGSVVINNLAALAAVGIAAIPLREVARLEAERRHRLQVARWLSAARLDAEDSAIPELASEGLPTYDG